VIETHTQPTSQLSDLTKNKTFCSMAWIHQFMDPTGRIKPCCRFEEIHRPADNHFDTKTLKEVFEGAWMNDVRAKMLAGEEVAGCSRCYQEQAAGKKSLRERYNESQQLPIEKLLEVSQPQLKWLELAISNDCNLACRMCDSRYSSKWFEEEQKMYGETRSPKKYSKMRIEDVFPYIPHLVHIKFTGGEPLITPDHWVLIKKLTEERNCKEIYLNYSTNCTVTPLPKWIELWDRFKFIEFALSFDSANKAEAEYIRWPAKFEKIEATTRAFLEMSRQENFLMILRTTVSLLNVWSLPETLLWWMENSPDPSKVVMNPTHLTHPNILSVKIITPNIKKKKKKKFAKYINGKYPERMKRNLRYIEKYMRNNDHTFLIGRLEKYIRETDTHRNQNFLESYPHYFDLFTQRQHMEERWQSEF